MLNVTGNCQIEEIILKPNVTKGILKFVTIHGQTGDLIISSLKFIATSKAFRKSKFLKKGDFIAITTAHLQSGIFINQDRSRKYFTEVIIKDFELIDIDDEEANTYIAGHKYEVMCNARD